METLRHVASLQVFHSVCKVLVVANVGRTSVSKVAILLIEHIGVASEHLLNGILHLTGQRLCGPSRRHIEFAGDLSSFLVRLFKDRPGRLCILKYDQQCLNIADRIVKPHFGILLSIWTIGLLVTLERFVEVASIVLQVHKVLWLNCTDILHLISSLHHPFY